MNFREFVNESFTKNTLEELEVLLKQHLEDAEKYKNSDVTAYKSSLKDIKAIKAAIEKLKGPKIKEKKKFPGNQNLGQGDSISVGGSGNMAAASPEGAGPGQGNAE